MLKKDNHKIGPFCVWSKQSYHKVVTRRLLWQLKLAGISWSNFLRHQLLLFPSIQWYFFILLKALCVAKCWIFFCLRSLGSGHFWKKSYKITKNTKQLFYVHGYFEWWLRKTYFKMWHVHFSSFLDLLQVVLNVL